MKYALHTALRWFHNCVLINALMYWQLFKIDNTVLAKWGHFICYLYLNKSTFFSWLWKHSLQLLWISASWHQKLICNYLVCSARISRRTRWCVNCQVQGGSKKIGRPSSYWRHLFVFQCYEGSPWTVYVWPYDSWFWFYKFS